VRGDGHAFNHAVRIAFQHASVHKRAWIAFIGVAQHILDVAWRLGGEFPFQSRGKPGAAASTKTGCEHFVNHGFGLHRERLCEARVAVPGNVLRKVERIDYATVAKHYFGLR